MGRLSLVAKCPKLVQTIKRLRFRGDMTLQEIANDTGVSVPTVMKYSSEVVQHRRWDRVGFINTRNGRVSGYTKRHTMVADDRAIYRAIAACGMLTPKQIKQARTALREMETLAKHRK